MKNIGIVTTWFERGAAYVSKQYQEILKDTFRTFIYARGGESYAKTSSEWNEPNVTWGKKTPLPVPMAIDKNDFINWIEDNQINIIIFNEQQWWSPILWAKEKGVICIAYIDYYTERTIPFFNIYDILLCNTKRHYSVFNWHKGAHYVPWGTKIDLYKATNNLKLINNDRVVFFHSSGVSPERKGTEELIDAFYNTTGDAKLIIHSQVDLNIKLATKKNLINNLINQDKLEIIAQTVTAPGLYHLGDIYVYPSRLDGIGLTIAEALSSGLPVIVPDSPPMNEFVDEFTGSKVTKIDKFFSRDDGYYWPQCVVSVDDLAKNLQYFIDNKDKISEFKSKTRKYAINNLDWINNKEQVCKIINSSKFTPIDEKIKNSIFNYEHKQYKFNIFFILYNKVPFLFYILKKVYNVFYR